MVTMCLMYDAVTIFLYNVILYRINECLLCCVCVCVCVRVRANYQMCVSDVIVNVCIK